MLKTLAQVSLNLYYYFDQSDRFNFNAFFFTEMQSLCLASCELWCSTLWNKQEKPNSAIRVKAKTNLQNGVSGCLEHESNLIGSIKDKRKASF